MTQSQDSSRIEQLYELLDKIDEAHEQNPNKDSDGFFGALWAVGNALMAAEDKTQASTHPENFVSVAHPSPGSPPGSDRTFSRRDVTIDAPARFTRWFISKLS